MGTRVGIKVSARLKICAAAFTSGVMLGGTTATAARAESPPTGGLYYFTYDCPAKGTVTTLNGINNHGDFAGTCFPGSFTGAANQAGQSSDTAIYGFLVRNGRFIKFAVPVTGPTGCQPCTFPAYMNASDSIVGFYYDHAGVGHGFIRDVAGNFTTIDDPKAGTNASVGAGTYAEGINDRGLVVGNYVDNKGVNHGFTWSHGVFGTVPNPPGTDTAAGDGVIPSDESPSGVLVGYYFNHAGGIDGFVLSGGHFFTLNLCKGESTGRTFLSGISNDGSTIVAETRCAGATRHSYVLRAGHVTEVNDPHAGTAVNEGTFLFAVDEAGDYAVGGFFDANDALHGMLVDIA
jgi:uncharacterized membrane protein